MIPAVKRTNQFLFERDSIISFQNSENLKLLGSGSTMSGIYLCVDNEDTRPKTIIRKQAKRPNFG